LIEEEMSREDIKRVTEPRDEEVVDDIILQDYQMIFFKQYKLHYMLQWIKQMRIESHQLS
jgi:hypothetical protein